VFQIKDRNLCHKFGASNRGEESKKTIKLTFLLCVLAKKKKTPD
jgi:hypothetical protein